MFRSPFPCLLDPRKIVVTQAAVEEIKTAHGLYFFEFVAIIAGLMAVNALGTDMMLPALPRIGSDLHVATANHQQWVISIYLGAFGVAQLFYGPLADRFGRRPVMLFSLALYAATSFLAAFASSFEMLLVARGLQGGAAASCRVLTISIIRDCYVGRRMASVSSLAFTVFLMVPILAPLLGQITLLVGTWHWIFSFLGIYSLGIAIWTGRRLPETLQPHLRRAISLTSIRRAAWSTFTNRWSIGYTMASGCMYGGLIGFLSSGEQIVRDGFGAPGMFAISFAAAAGTMAVAALTNARIVERCGTRMVSHTALIAMIMVGTVRCAIVLTGHETLLVFVIMQGLTMFCFGFAGPNFGAMAMEEMGHIAGTASACQGFISSMIGSLIGLIIGQSYVQNSFPLALGVTLAAVTALLIILVVERGRLMQPHFPPPAPVA